jgi:ABC-type transporter Mla subunit MlaD
MIVVVYLAMSFGVLAFLLVHAWRRSNDALTWCASQQALAEAVCQTPSAAPVEGDPGPLGQRDRLLGQLHDTAIAEGQLVSLVFRREEIPGHHEAGNASHYLVVAALGCSILGLCGTLLWLGWSMRSLSPEGPPAPVSAPAAPPDLSGGTPVDTVEQLVSRLRGPLGHLGFLFLPTAVGLALAMVTTWRQQTIDVSVEATWQELDRVTLECLFPRYFAESARSAQQDAVRKLSEASGLFSEAARQIMAAMDGVRGSLEQISKLDQSRWAEDLKGAAQEFRQHVHASSDNLVAASGRIDEALNRLPAATNEMADITHRLAGASEQVLETTRKTEQALQAIGGTLEPLTQLPASVDRVSGSVDALGSDIKTLAGPVDNLRNLLTQWSDEQSKWLHEARDAIDKLDDTMRPMIDQARALHEETQAGREQALASLQTIRANLAEAGQELQTVLGKHETTLNGLPGELEEAIRAGHEAWLVEVGQRFDQDEKVFTELRALTDQLGACRQAFEAARELAEEAQGPGQQLIRSAEQALVDLKQSVTHLADTMTREDEWSRPETWRDMLDRHVRALDATLQPLRSLPALQASVTELGRDIHDLSQQMDRLYRPGIVQSAWTWLQGQRRGPRKPSQ